MPRKNDLVTLDVTDMTHEGSGVGHLDGMAVFEPASAVGRSAGGRRDSSSAPHTVRRLCSG